MEKKSQIIVITLAGLSLLYVLFSFLSFITGGKWGIAVNKKISIGTAIIALCFLLNGGERVSAQEITPTPPVLTATTIITPDVTGTATTTIKPTVTRTATATRTPTRTYCYTPYPGTRPPTGTRTRTATSVVTPSINCTCDTGCSTAIAIIPDFTKDGIGQFCFEAESLGVYINSWNMESLKVNGVEFANKWTAAASLPAKINGKYYIDYKSTISYSHFEAMNQI